MMVIACLVSIAILLSGITVYSILVVATKADHDYERLKREILKEMAGEKKCKQSRKKT